MSRTICIYHANCADGFTAAWAVREALGDAVEFIAAGYGDAPPDVTGADVAIVDFSYKRPVLERMAQTARSILVLDHHKTARDDLASLPRPSGGWEAHRSAAGNPVAIFDMDRSGAQLAWDYFNRGSRPFLVDVVADRDLWRWQIERSREINAVIGSHQMTWDTWDDLAARLQADEDIGRVAAEGEAILRAHDKLVREVIQTSMRRMVIGGHDVPVAAAPYALASDTAGTMAEGEPFAATYIDGPKGRAFSLRARGDGIDVSEIAKVYGGGGHRGAAGFLMPHGWEGASGEYIKRELVDLKEGEIARLRGALDAIETATATGDGLSPDETIRVNQVAHRAVATAAGVWVEPNTDRAAHHAARYGRTKVAKIIEAYDDLRRAVRERDLEAAEAALDRYEPWADYALGQLSDLPKEP